MSQESYALFCMGNPLLDIQVKNGEKLLKKYDLKANDAILADEKHLPMFDIPHSHFYNLFMLIPL
jgi:adenosine kinase